jgi:putative ABC transport system permease protein
VLPHQGIGIYLAVVSVSVAVTLGTSLVTARRVLRAPAVEAVALAA